MHKSGLAIAALLTVGASSATAAPQHPVVLELFTSQGCSSCPPADAFLEELARNPRIIAISRPVTYWNRLGWTDTLARSENDALQRRYATKGMEGSGVYTPQSIVQGRFGAVGSDRNKVNAQLANARRDLKAAVAVRGDRVGVAGEGAPAEVRVVWIGSDRVVRIGSGENARRTIRYTNVVLAEQVVGQWRGGATQFSIPQRTVTGADRRAVIVQMANGGPILAASWL